MFKRETPDGPWVVALDPYGGPWLWPIWAAGFLVFGLVAAMTVPLWGPVVAVMYILKRREAPVPAKDTPRARWDGGTDIDYHAAAVARNRIALEPSRPKQGTKR